jgi:23S rRNA (guanosine2251-2'-O)-methyltransferase
LEALRAHPERVDRLLIADGQLGAKAAAEIFSRARDAGVRVDRVGRERLAVLAEGGVHQGVVARMQTFEYVAVEDLLELARESGRPALLVVLDGIQDPQNLGAIVRSAHALGAHGVIIGKDRAAPVSAAVVKASAGAIEHCPVAQVVNVSRALETLKEAGVWTVAADPEGAEVLWEKKLEGPLALVVGGEGPGVRPGVLKHCDFRVRIPLAGQVASLNASVSAAVVLYEVLRQRGMPRPLDG